MYLTSETKKEIFKTHGRAQKAEETGSAEAQIALFTHRINHLTKRSARFGVSRTTTPAAKT